MNEKKKTILVLAGLITFIVVIYTVFGTKGPSPVTLTQMRLRELQPAVMEWCAKHGSPPVKLSDLGLPDEAIRDHKGTPFVYHVDGSTVTISSLGADGKPGGHMFMADHSVTFDCRESAPEDEP